jgi:plastocyanin
MVLCKDKVEIGNSGLKRRRRTGGSPLGNAPALVVQEGCRKFSLKRSPECMSTRELVMRLVKTATFVLRGALFGVVGGAAHRAGWRPWPSPRAQAPAETTDWKMLIVAVLLLSAVPLYTSAAIAPAGEAQPSNAGSVTVTDSAITPASVTILAGGSVVWTNRGSRLHKIVSSRAAFDAFELTPAHSHRVLFSSPGVYPYTVDGVLKGTVVVSNGVPPGNAPTGPSSTPGTPRHSWKGTVHATATYTTHVPCVMDSAGCGSDGIARGGPYIGTYDGTLALAEDADGRITGQGGVSASGCEMGPSSPPAKHISFEVRGVDNGKQLELQIIPSSFRRDGVECGFAFGWMVYPGASPSSAVIPITAPGTAQGPWHGRAEFPVPITTGLVIVDFQFALTCTDCRKPH